MSSRTQSGQVAAKSLPGYAKTLLVFQALVIAFFALWFYEQYLNDQYFQKYVNDQLQTNLPGYILFAMLGISLLATVAYVKTRILSNGSRRSIHLEIVGSGVRGPKSIERPTRESRTGASVKRTVTARQPNSQFAQLTREVEPSTGFGTASQPRAIMSELVGQEQPENVATEESDVSVDEILDSISRRPGSNPIELRRRELVRPPSTRKEVFAQPLGPHRPTIALRNVEPEQRLAERQFLRPRASVDDRVDQLGEAQNMTGQQSPALSRVRPGPGINYRPPIQRPATVLSRAGSAPESREAFPSLQRPRASRREPGRGPLDNPLPDDPLVPIERPPRPRQTIEEPSVQRRAPARSDMELGLARVNSSWSPMQPPSRERAEGSEGSEEKGSVGSHPPIPRQGWSGQSLATQTRDPAHSPPPIIRSRVSHERRGPQTLSPARVEIPQARDQGSEHPVPMDEAAPLQPNPTPSTADRQPLPAPVRVPGKGDVSASSGEKAPSKKRSIRPKGAEPDLGSDTTQSSGQTT